MPGRNRAVRLFSTVVIVASVPAMLAGCAMWERMTGQRVTLSGEHEQPPVQTSASGTARVAVEDDCSVSGMIEVSGMTPTAAHIHTGGPKENGPVAVAFDKVSDSTFRLPEGARLSPSQCRAYKAGRTYVNVHSKQHPGGELRAQLEP